MAEGSSSKRFTTSILTAAGEDCNPLNRRLPAEVISRRRPQQQKKPVPEKVIEEVPLDLKSVAAMKPEARVKWLTKAFKMINEEGRSVTELYTTLTSRKFVSGLPSKIGRKLGHIIRQNLGIFSDKQKKYITSDDCPLEREFPINQSRDEEDDEAAEDESSKQEDMMARCRAFVREQASTFDDKKRQVDEVERKETEHKNVTREAAGMDQEDVRKKQREREAAAHARREALEREERERRREADLEEARRRLKEEEEKKKAAQEEEARRLEDQADSSLDLLERMQQRNEYTEPPKRPNKEFGGRDRDNGRGRDVRGRGRSVSRSISAPRRRGSTSSSPPRLKARDRSRSMKMRGRNPQPPRRSSSRSRERNKRRDVGDKRKKQRKRSSSSSGADPETRRRIAEREATRI
eukprot:gnl/TRDRNA2_/TRDRNA2_85567_c0_seq1.p1 gnl/TRDRNA2_/TRDRNA2_85567_c0~~gnl/TRDRNA2_/TRDRNA2_85567_c0_seq1.p1  ORF type:complete len:408 (+),score=85.61 gnl/TRDRNA2_/TRDRNA2_85567_c0_seq1:198-1421(+)